MSNSRMRHLISSIENKYQHREPGEDCVVDITTMKVVDSKRRSQRRSQISQSVQRTSSPRKNRPSTSSNVEYITPGGVEHQKRQLTMYQPPVTSRLFDTTYQIHGLRNLWNLLQNDDNNGVLITNLTEKALKTLGLNTLPSSESVHPFIHITDDGAPRISFVYDSPPSTPWKAYLNALYPFEFQQLSRKIYELLLNPCPVRVFGSNLNAQLLPMIHAGSVLDSESVRSTSDETYDDLLPIAKPLPIRRTPGRPRKLTTTNHSISSDDVDSLPVTMPSRRASGRPRRLPSKLTTTIDKVIDSSDEEEEFVPSKGRKRITNGNVGASNKKQAKTPQIKAVTSKKSTATRSTKK